MEGVASRRRHDELRIVLLGATGAGKSATGNSFLRQDKFKENVDPQAGSYNSQTEVTYNIEGFPGTKLCITDTPRLYSTVQDQNQVLTHIVQFIGQLCPGPHVIVIVVSAGQRVSKEVQTAVETFCMMFGENSTTHMMFLFTNIDRLQNSRFDPQPVPIKKWVRDLLTKDETLRKVFDKCGNRFCGINNRADMNGREYQQQIAEIMNMFLDIVRQNGGTYYTNEDFTLIEEKLMAPLDRITGDRSKSQSDIAKYLIGTVGAGGMMGAATVAAETGVAILSAEAGVGAVAGAVVAGGLAATGVAIVAGISTAAWGLYQGYKYVFVNNASKKIKSE